MDSDWRKLAQSDVHLILVGWVTHEDKNDRPIVTHYRCCNEEEFQFLRSPGIQPPPQGKENIIRCYVGRIRVNKEGALNSFSNEYVLLHWEDL